jgi:cytochrome c-type biogenesis protein CcmF
VLAPVGATLGLWIILSSLIDPVDRLRRRLSLSRAVLGMSVAHIGLGVAVIALTCVGAFTTERDLSLAQGATAEVGGYQFRFDGVQAIEGPNYEGVGGTITVSRAGRALTVLHPQKRKYWVQGQVTTEAAIEMHSLSNVLVALGEDLGAGRWSIRVQIRPLVNFIWLGAFIMGLGGALAATDRRYRTAKAAQTQGVPVGAAATAGGKSP